MLHFSFYYCLFLIAFTGALSSSPEQEFIHFTDLKTGRVSWVTDEAATPWIGSYGFLGSKNSPQTLLLVVVDSSNGNHLGECTTASQNKWNKFSWILNKDALLCNETGSVVSKVQFPPEEFERTFSVRILADRGPRCMRDLVVQGERPSGCPPLLTRDSFQQLSLNCDCPDIETTKKSFISDKMAKKIESELFKPTDVQTVVLDPEGTQEMNQTNLLLPNITINFVSSSPENLINNTLSHSEKSADTSVNRIIHELLLSGIKSQPFSSNETSDDMSVQKETKNFSPNISSTDESILSEITPPSLNIPTDRLFPVHYEPEGVSNLTLSNHPCENIECLNGGSCVLGIGNEATCQCLPGFSGIHCEEIMCDEQCGNRGTCEVINNERICHCFEGFTGQNCEQIVCDPPCGENGICISKNSSSECDCYQGFLGKNCMVIDTCEKERVCDSYSPVARCEIEQENYLRLSEMPVNATYRCLCKSGNDWFPCQESNNQKDAEEGSIIFPPFNRFPGQVHESSSEGILTTNRSSMEDRSDFVSFGEPTTDSIESTTNSSNISRFNVIQSDITSMTPSLVKNELPMMQTKFVNTPTSLPEDVTQEANLSTESKSEVQNNSDSTSLSPLETMPSQTESDNMQLLTVVSLPNEITKKNEESVFLEPTHVDTVDDKTMRVESTTEGELEMPVVTDGFLVTTVVTPTMKEEDIITSSPEPPIEETTIVTSEPPIEEPTIATSEPPIEEPTIATSEPLMTTTTTPTINIEITPFEEKTEQPSTPYVTTHQTNNIIETSQANKKDDTAQSSGISWVLGVIIGIASLLFVSIIGFFTFRHIRRSRKLHGKYNPAKEENAFASGYALPMTTVKGERLI